MSIILDANAPDGATSQNQGSDLIKDSSVETFVQDVIEPSMEVPVVVDFWAPWCGPCKNLTPVIEKVTREAGGRVKLVKVNIDENQELAMQLRIQSVPTVYAFKGGRPVDGFQGAQPESEVRAFYEKLAGGRLKARSRPFSNRPPRRLAMTISRLPMAFTARFLSARAKTKMTKPQAA